MAPGASYIALMKGIPPVAVVPMEVSCNEYSSSNRKTFVKKERNKKAQTFSGFIFERICSLVFNGVRPSIV